MTICVRGWTLIDRVTRRPVSIGDERDCHNETRAVTVRSGCPPHKVNSTGKVYIGVAGESFSSEVYPSVIGCLWLHEGGGVSELD